jgi:hypothetical protein
MPPSVEHVLSPGTVVVYYPYYSIFHSPHFNKRYHEVTIVRGETPYNSLSGSINVESIQNVRQLLLKPKAFTHSMSSKLIKELSSTTLVIEKYCAIVRLKKHSAHRPIRSSWHKPES